MKPYLRDARKEKQNPLMSIFLTILILAALTDYAIGPSYWHEWKKDLTRAKAKVVAVINGETTENTSSSEVTCADDEYMGSNGCLLIEKDGSGMATFVPEDKSMVCDYGNIEGYINPVEGEDTIAKTSCKTLGQLVAMGKKCFSPADFRRMQNKLATCDGKKAAAGAHLKLGKFTDDVFGDLGEKKLSAMAKKATVHVGNMSEKELEAARQQGPGNPFPEEN